MSIRFPNLGLELNYVGRSFSLFGFEITFAGLCMALGMLLALAFVVLEAKRGGEDQNQYLTVFILVLLGGIAGARLFYTAFSWGAYQGDLRKILDIRSGGMSFYGGLFGGILTGALYCGIRRLSFMRMADTASMGILIGQIIGKWGSFFNRESFGQYTNTVLAMQVPLSAVSAGEVTAAMRENLTTINGVSYVQVHPVFLYESAWCLLLFLLMLVWKRKKRFCGEIFLRYLTFYSLGRCVFEWLRTDKMMMPGLALPVSLAISAALFVVCGTHLLIRSSMEKKRARLRRQRRGEAFRAERNQALDVGAEKDEDSWDAILAETEKILVSREDKASKEKTEQPDKDQGGSKEKSEAEPEA